MSYPGDPVLLRFRAALGDVFGARLERATLFGSRARGDARADSDYDIAVFLHDMKDFGEEAGRLAEIETDILYDTGAVINALPFMAGAWRGRIGLMGELEREGRSF
ncbi:MAG TPA: nucleotidyltransferase domain-containing protein [Rhizomicrobium sp.]|jgi:predicted nucleotidyltransferase|nr:nucleotidyltransferase domain-containing protein [Rhizomicrobium sp.]